MAADFDAKLTRVAASIFRDALQVYRQGDTETWFSGYNPVLNAWNSGMFGHLEMSRSPQGPTDSSRVAPGSSRATGKNGASQTTFRLPFCLPRTLPAVRLPPPEVLAASARSAPLMGKLHALALWLGRDGRPVTRDGLLHDADAADAVGRLDVRPDLLPYLWEHALVSGWFELVDGPDGRQSWVVLGSTAYRWADEDIFGVLHVWATVFASVLARKLEVIADQAPEAARLLNFQGQGVALAVILFLARQTGVTMDDASDIVQDGAIGDPSTGRAKKAWDAWVREFGDPARSLLLELAALRAVSLPTDDDGILTLSPLAQWALREQFMLDGISIEVIPASEEMLPSDLVQLADVVSEAEFDAEFKAWFRRHPPGHAARDLLMYAASADAHDRVAVINLLHRTGKASAGAWVEAMESAELRGYALIALATMATDRAESRLPMVRRPDPNDLDGVAGDLLSLIGGDDANPERVAACFAEVIPAGSAEWVFGLMAQGFSPNMRRVLEVLGHHHPDRNIARGARKAARASAGHRPAPEPAGYRSSLGQAGYRSSLGQARTPARNVQAARPSLPRR